MNTPFKGQIDWLPDFIGEELMNQQAYQGNKRDISVFEKNIGAYKSKGGFSWDKTQQGYDFWSIVLVSEDINLFLAWFKPELEVWDCEDKKYTAQVIGYNKNKRYSFFVTNNQTNGFTFKHAQLPKKEDKAKTELLKKVKELTRQAAELLTKAAELKAAAEKL